MSSPVSSIFVPPDPSIGQAPSNFVPPDPSLGRPKSVINTQDDRNVTQKIIGGLLEGATSTIPAAATSIIHPYDALTNLIQSHKDTYSKAVDSFKSGDISGGLQHLASSGIPLIGPMADDLVDYATSEKADPEEAARKLGSVLVALGAPKAIKESPALLKSTAGRIWPDLLKADVSKDLINSYSPTDPRFNERAPGAAADIKKYAIDGNGKPVTITGNEHLASTSPSQVVTPALQANRAAMDAWHQPVQQAGITASPSNILKATQDSLKSMADPTTRQALLDEARGEINQQPLTADRLKELIEEKNGELKGFYSKDPAIQAAAKQAGAVSGKSQALLEAQAQALRDEYYNMLDPQNGGAGPREIQRRYGAIKMLQDEASAGATRNKILGETGGSAASKFTQAGLNTLDLVGAPFREGGLSEGLNRILEPFRGETDPLIKRAFANAPDSTPLPQAPSIQQRYPQSFGSRQITAGTTPPVNVQPSSGRVIITPQSSQEAIAQGIARAADTTPGVNDVGGGYRTLGPARTIFQGTEVPPTKPITVRLADGSIVPGVPLEDRGLPTDPSRTVPPVQQTSGASATPSPQPFRVGFPPEAPKQLLPRDPNNPAPNSAPIFKKDSGIPFDKVRVTDKTDALPDSGGGIGPGFGVYRVPLSEIISREDITGDKLKAADIQDYANRMKAGDEPPAAFGHYDPTTGKVTITSGSRRFAAANVAGKEDLPVAISSDYSPESGPPTEFQQGKMRNEKGQVLGGKTTREVVQKGQPVITTQNIEPANPTAPAYVSPRMRALMDEEANRQYGVKYSDLRDGSTQKAFVDSQISKNLMRLNSLMQGKVQ
jgi:hypothetical protein